jgi:hypothetical protein
MPFRIDEIKSWFLAHFLKSYILPDNRPPVRRPKRPKEIDPPVFKDRYAERTSDIEFQRFNDMIQESVANIKSGLDPDD